MCIHVAYIYNICIHITYKTYYLYKGRLARAAPRGARRKANNINTYITFGGFAENRQPLQKPPQEKESELKVKQYSCISHSAAFSC